MQDCKVAVVLATYHCENYIIEQLDSLLKQTRRIDEVLIVDDTANPNGGGYSLVADFIRQNNLDTSWSLKANEKNVGHAANFINMCKQIDADYIFFCDQDDIWMEDKIERMLAIMEKNSEVLMLCGEPINFTNKSEIEEIVKNRHFSNKVNRIPFSPQNYFFKGIGCCSCIRGDFMKKSLPYWTTGWEHDMFFWTCAILQNGAFMMDSPVIYRRCHYNNASFSGVKTREKRIQQIESSLNRPQNMIKMMDDLSINEEDKRHFLQKYQNSLRVRNKMLHNHNIFNGIRLLLFYRDCYLWGKKGIALDIMLSVFKQYPIK